MVATPHALSLHALAVDLARERTSARALVEAALAAIEDPAGEGARAFVQVDAEGARAAADHSDRQRRAGLAPSWFAGLPIAVKDLFDVRGQVTRAGSRALDDAPAATSDARAVARLRRAGFIVIGRSNMSEFAYSGLGLNPHFGTPRSVFDRQTGRAPGGSTSGGAVAVADKMAVAALGTDTGGSCRIPAAFNGLTGWKPTSARMPGDGLIPLSPSLDTVGPIARTVRCCAVLDAILSGAWPRSPRPLPLAGRRLLAPTTVVLDDLDAPVAAAFDRALAALSAAGATIEQSPLPEIHELIDLTADGGLTAIESHAWHESLLAARGGDYDPRVAARIRKGATIPASRHQALLDARAALVERLRIRLRQFDALVAPTVAAIPPRLDALQDDAAFAAANLRALRNTMLVNLMNGCAITLPATAPGEAPAGLMLAAPAHRDAALLALAAGVERVLARSGSGTGGG